MKTCPRCKVRKESTEFHKDSGKKDGLNHETGEIRGLLCRNCNLGVGYLMDNTELMQSAIKYLGTKKG